VTRQKLDFAEVGSGFEQMDGVGVAQGVRARPFLQTSPLAGVGHGLADGIPAQRFAGRLPGKQPVPRSHLPPITAQQFQQLRRQLDVAVLPPLALLDPNHHALAVDIGGAQMNGLTHARPGTVHRAEDDVVRKGRSGLQQPQDLFRAENHGQPGFRLGSRDQIEGPIPLQSDLVEEPRGAHRYGPGAGSGMSLLRQVDLVGANLFRA